MATFTVKPEITDDDEIVTVTLPRKDYLVLREMIEQRNSLNWIGKYFTNVLFVLAGGILTWIAFGEQVIKALKVGLGIH